MVNGSMVKGELLSTGGGGVCGERTILLVENMSI